MNTVAARVRLARSKRGLSQAALGGKSEVSSTYVLMVERGDDESFATNERIQRPGNDQLAKLAKALDVPVEWLAFGVGSEPDWSSNEPRRTESSSDLKAVEAPDPKSTGTDDEEG